MSSRHAGLLPSCLRIPAAAVLALFASAHPVLAQWSSSASTNLQVSASTSQTGIPSAFSDHAGGAVLAWADGRGTCVQRLDAFGIAKWGVNGMVISPTNATLGYRAVSDDAGGVIVGWAESAVGHSGLFVQRVDRNGAQRWTAGGISLTSSGTGAAMCADGAGGAVVVWALQSGLNVEIWANRITAAGALPWGAVGKLVVSGQDLSSLDFAIPSAGGGCFVGWHHNLLVNISDPDTFFFQRLDGSGNRQWPTPTAPSPLRLITLDDTQLQRSCAGTSAAFFTTQRNDSLFLNRLPDTGTFASPAAGWPVIGMPTGRARTGLANAMIPDGAGGVVMAWRDDSYLTVFGRVRAQRVNASGARQWPTAGGTFVEVCPASPDESFPGLMQDGLGNFLVGWEDYRNGLHINLYAEKLDAATGALLWTSNGIPFATAADNQFEPVFAPGNPGNAIAAFDDARTGQEKLYAQFLGNTGALTPPNTVSFSPVAPSPVARGASGYATDGAFLYVEGGGAAGGGPASNTVGRYDPVANSWATIGTYVARYFGSLAYVPQTGKLYALNGNDNISAYRSEVEEITLPGGASTLKAVNPMPRELPGIAVWNGRIYVISGNQDPNLLNDVRWFDPVANAWSGALAPIPLARMGLACAPYEGFIYAAGGTTNGITGSRRLDRYDIAGNSWAQMSDAPLPVMFHASAVTGGLLWFIGDNGITWTLMSYAPATDTWTLHSTNMVGRRFGQAVGVGNKLIVAGGGLGTPNQDVLDTQISDVATLVAGTPIASVTLAVAGPGTFSFTAPGENTNLSIAFTSVTGSGTVTVARYPGPTANVAFAVGNPTAISNTNWVITQTGLTSFSADVTIGLTGLPDAIGPGSGVSMYHRSTPGTGAFSPLATTYSAGPNSVTATVTSFSEFLLGSGGPVGVEPSPHARLALRRLGSNPSATLAFSVALPSATPARLALYDVQGRVLVERRISGAGTHTVRFDRERLPSGLCFARLTQGGTSAIARVVIAR